MSAAPQRPPAFEPVIMPTDQEEYRRMRQENPARAPAATPRPRPALAAVPALRRRKRPRPPCSPALHLRRLFLTPPIRSAAHTGGRPRAQEGTHL
ncbi:hypothetical protein ACFQ3Z_16240 [Streptomyces nogalater]